MNILYVNIRKLSRVIDMDDAIAMLPWEERREAAGQFRFDDDRWRCIGAGLLAAQALRQAGAEDLALIKNEHGKPALANYPHLHFNLSHSGDFAVCAVSAGEGEVGVDVEKPRKADMRVARRCYCERELEWLEEYPDKDEAFIKLWVRKESLLKYLGIGLSKEPSKYCVLDDGSEEYNVSFAEYEDSGHLICVCGSRGAKAEFVEADPHILTNI